MVANEFNNYFNSIASNLNDAIEGHKLADFALKTFEDYLFPSRQQSMYLEGCTPEEIMKKQ